MVRKDDGSHDSRSYSRSKNIFLPLSGFVTNLASLKKLLKVSNRVVPDKGGHWEIIKKQNLGGK